jgi:hypothetical protein
MLVGLRNMAGVNNMIISESYILWHRVDWYKIVIFWDVVVCGLAVK